MSGKILKEVFETKLLFKQRLFSWFDSYDIYDETEQTVYVVKGQLAWGHCLKIFSVYGEEVGTEVRLHGPRGRLPLQAGPLDGRLSPQRRQGQREARRRHGASDGGRAAHGARRDGPRPWPLPLEGLVQVGKSQFKSAFGL